MTKPRMNPVVGATAAGVGITAALALFGKAGESPEIMANLTEIGRYHYRPEREIVIYIVGCILSVGLCVLLGDWGWNGRRGKGVESAGSGRRPPSIVDVLFMLVPTGLLFTWNSGEMVAEFLRKEALHHWNFFIAGPATAYGQGGSLITGYYAQYGVGWPVVMNWLAGGTPSYELMVRTGSLYACVYFAGLYIFLRSLTNSPVRALGGVTLGLLAQFAGSLDILWRFPSSTILRAPLDVWIFLLLLTQARRPKVWKVLALGFLTGAAVLFELDTGVYIGAAILGVFAPCTLRWGTAGERSSALKAVTAGGLIFVGTIWLGLEIASRGTWELSATGIKLWAEGALAQTSTVGLLPITRNRIAVVILFTAIAATYIKVTAGTMALRLRRELTPEGATVGTIAAYGMAYMLLFVGRSAGYNLFHPLIPLAIVMAWALGKNEWRAAVTVAIAGAMIGLTPSCRNYPNIFNQDLAWFDGKRTSEERMREEGWNEMVEVAKECKATGRSFACLDRGDTVVYLKSGTRPWGRYSPSMPILTKDRRAGIFAEIKTAGPDCLAIGREWGGGATGEGGQTGWIRGSEIDQSGLEGSYRLVKRTGAYSLWERRDKPEGGD